MKFTIIIIGLFVFAECYGKEDHHPSSCQMGEDESPDQIEEDDLGSEISEAIARLKSPKLLDFCASINAVNPFMVTANGEKNQMTPMSVDEMMQRAVSNRDNAMKNATLKLDEMKQNVQTIRKQAEMERDKALKTIEAQCNKAEGMANDIIRKANGQVSDARIRSNHAFHQTALAADEELKKAIKESEAALQAAEDIFVTARDQIQEKKRKMETEHQDVLKKACKEQEAAMRLAKEKMEAAKQDYEKAMEMRPEMKSNGKATTESELQKEMDSYQEALKLAESEYKTVFDSIGGKEFEEALENVFKNLAEAREEANLIFENATEKHEKTLTEAKMKKMEVNRQAKEGSLRLQDEYMKIMEKAANHKTDKTQEVWQNWKNMETKANDELDKAKMEFAEAKMKAMDEWRMTMQMIDEMKKKSAEEDKTKNVTPPKVVKRKRPQNPRPKKKSSESTASKTSN